MERERGYMSYQMSKRLFNRRYSSLQLYNYEKKLYRVKDYKTNQFIKVVRAKDKWIFNNKIFITANELNRYLKITMQKEA